MEEHRDWVVVKVDVRNAHNEIWRSAIISSLEAEPTLQHLAWFAAVVLAPSTGLETGGQLWGSQGEGETQGDPKASAFFATAIQRAVCQFDEELQAAGGKARFGNDNGYGCGPQDVVFPALARLAENLQNECGLSVKGQAASQHSSRGDMMVNGTFEPGFDF